MKKFIFAFIALFVGSITYSAPGDTTWVQAHNIQLDYYNNFDDTVVFPDQSKTYRKILMYFTMGKYNCPSGTQYCHQWDYDIENYLIKDGDTIEITRLVTPYATSGWDRFDGNWTQPYVFDVTNFAPKMHDSAVIRLHYSGYSGGFTANVRFAFIEGTPSRDVLGIQEVYQVSTSYGNAANPIGDHFPVQSYTTPAGTKDAEMKVLITGHGSDANGCCEFMSHNYQIKLNSNTVADQAIWRDVCGRNELYPQGGTWVYNRANWCPGELVHPIYHELSALNTGGASFDVQMTFDSYTATADYGSYKTSAVIFYYGDFNKTLDASIEDIISPTTDVNHFRENPTGSMPQIVVKNTGKDAITSIKFSYGVKDSTQQTYTWTGTLNSLDTAVITLDALSALKNMSYQELSGEYQFDVNILEVNGQTDEDATNNAMKSDFIVAPTWPARMVLTLKTSNLVATASGAAIGNPDQSWVITDMQGNVVASRTNTMADVEYIDTIGIPTPGFYKLTLSTNNNFGLHWWPYDGYSQVHQGYFKLKKMSGYFIPMKNYVYSGQQRHDWGSIYTQYFTISPQSLAVKTQTIQKSITVYPNPASQTVNVDLGSMKGKGSLRMINMMGQTVYSTETEDAHVKINVSTLDASIYTLLYSNGNVRGTQKIVVNK